MIAIRQFIDLYPIIYILLGLDCADDHFKITGPNACEVKPHSKPWIVTLVRCIQSLCLNACSGTILSTTRVLTAAHCVRPRLDEPKYHVVLADHDREEKDDGERTIDVDQVIRPEAHPPRGRVNLIHFLALV